VYSQTHASRWIGIDPPRELSLPDPFTSNLAAPMSLTQSTYAVPATGIAVIPHARLMGAECWVIGENDTFLGNFHEEGDSRFAGIYGLVRPSPPIFLPGQTLNLCSAYAGHNFYHWMMDGIARADLFLRTGFSWNDVTQVLVPKLDSEATRAVVAALKIPSTKILRPPYGAHYVCEELWQPTLPSLARLPGAASVAFHRGLLPLKERNQPRTKRLYIGRAGPRGPIDLSTLEDDLRRNGFEKAEVENFEYLREQLSSASHVVAIHGAAMTNLLYCQPGTRVLELIPSNNAWPFYRALCAAGDMPYGAVVGTSARRRLHPKVPRNASFAVDPQEFKTALAQLLAAG
jgi:hypothetical protein